MTRVDVNNKNKLNDFVELLVAAINDKNEIQKRMIIDKIVEVASQNPDEQGSLPVDNESYKSHKFTRASSFIADGLVLLDKSHSHSDISDLNQTPFERNCKAKQTMCRCGVEITLSDDQLLANPWDPQMYIIQEHVSWSFDIFKVKEAVRSTLVAVSSCAFAYYGIQDFLCLSPRRLREFLQMVERGYDNIFSTAKISSESVTTRRRSVSAKMGSNHNPYHNSIHAADVLCNVIHLSMTTLLAHTMSQEDIITLFVAALAHGNSVTRGIFFVFFLPFFPLLYTLC